MNDDEAAGEAGARTYRMRFRLDETTGFPTSEICDETTGKWRAATNRDYILFTGLLIGATQDTISRLGALMKALKPDLDEATYEALAIGLHPGSAKDEDEIRALRKGTVQTLIELRKVHDSVLALRNLLHGLGHEANCALGAEYGGREGKEKIEDALDALQCAAALGYNRASKDPYTPAKRKPKKEAPRDVASSAKYAFEKLTDRKATIVTRNGKAGGPFLEFLAKVFEILEIKGSPEAAARGLWKKGSHARQ